MLCPSRRAFTQYSKVRVGITTTAHSGLPEGRHDSHSGLMLPQLGHDLTVCMGVWHAAGRVEPGLHQPATKPRQVLQQRRPRSASSLAMNDSKAVGNGLSDWCCLLLPVSRAAGGLWP